MSLFLKILLFFTFSLSIYAQQLSFVENNGFSQEPWKYVLRGPKSSIYFYDTYFVIQTFQQSGKEIVFENIPIYFDNQNAYIEHQITPSLESKTYRINSSTKTSSSSHFESIVYRNCTKNVDCRFFIFNNELRFDFIIKDPSVSTISLSTSEGNSFSLEQSKIYLTSSSHSKHLLKDISLVYPYKSEVTTFISSNKQSLNFSVPPKNDFVIIDPTFSFASFLGGSSSEYIYDVKILDNNRLYAVGYTTSLDFPTTPGVYKTTTTSADVFVYAVDLNTNSLLFSTFLGGTNSEIGYGIDIASNTIIICGQTNSLNFPVTPGAFSTTFNGGNQDGFVAGLSINGNSLQFSTFVGGSDSDVLYKLAVNNQGSIFACGMSRSANFPIGSNPAQFTKGNGNDGVIVSLSPTAASLFGGTFLGGNNEDRISNLSISSTNEIVVIGSTSSPNFPLQQPMYPTYNGGLSDAFITRYNQNLSTVLFSTYFGGTNDDNGNSISFDSQNNIIFGGTTNSNNIPTLNEIYKNNRGGNDVFLAKILPNRTLDFSTYIGGTNDDNLEDLAVNSFGNIYITGFTNSNNFPLSNDAPFPENNGSGDMFISKLYRSGQSVLYSTFYGDIFQDVSTSLSINSSGNVALGGYTQSSTLQTLNSIDSTFNGGFFDAYLLTFFLPDQTTTINTDSVKLSYCRGTADSVTFSFVGGFERNNSFVVELSDTNGNFSPGRVIGTLQSPNPRPIRFFIPFDVLPSSQYKIRVRSSSPSVAGTPTVHTIRINEAPKPTLGNDTVLCLGSQIELGSTLEDFPLVQWFSTDTTIKNIISNRVVITPKKTHKYWSTVTDSNGCLGIDTIVVAVVNPPKKFLPKTIQFCETDTISFIIPDTLVITDIVANNATVFVIDSLISLHTTVPTSVIITIMNKKNGCYLIDTLQLTPINLVQVTFTQDSFNFPEKQECENYTQGVITILSSATSTILLDSLVIENTAFSFDSLTINRKKNQISLQPNTQLTIPIYFIGNGNENSLVRLYSSKCILTDSIFVSGNANKNSIQIPQSIIHNKELVCRNNKPYETYILSIFNITNSRKIVSIDTNKISTIKFVTYNYILNSKDSIFIEYSFTDPSNSQSDTVFLTIEDSVCTKMYTIVIQQNVTNLQNEYSIESMNVDTILCDVSTFKIGLPITKIVRNNRNVDTLLFLNTYSGIVVNSNINIPNTVSLAPTDSLYFTIDINTAENKLYNYKAVILPCNDTLEFDFSLNAKSYLSTIFNNSIIQKTSTNDSINYTISFIEECKDEVESMLIRINGIKIVNYSYDSLRTVRFAISNNSISTTDSLLFTWGEKCMFTYSIPVEKVSSEILYSIDSLSALPGDTVSFAVRSLVLSGNLPISDTLTLSTNKYLLYPIDYSTSFDADTVKISIPFLHTSNDISLKMIRFLALLGDTNRTTLRLTSSSSIPANFTNGQFTLLPICLDRDIFVKESSSLVTIQVVFANSSYYFSEYIVDSHDDLTIEVYSYLGQKIPSELLKTSLYEYELSAKYAENPVYYLVVRNSKNSLFIPILR